MTGLKVAKNENETWRQCVERYAKPHGLEEECLALFDEEVSAGSPENQAAFNSLYEWDCLDLVEEG